MKELLVCGLVVVLVSCESAPPQPPTAQVASDEEALVVATFEHFYGLVSEDWQGLVAETHGQSPPKDPTTHYYITVLGKDPSAELLAHFKTKKAAFHPGSTFRNGDGVAFEVKNITFEKRGTAAVEFEHYCGSLCGYSTTYCFEKRNGVWQFVKICGSETMS